YVDLTDGDYAKAVERRAKEIRAALEDEEDVERFDEALEAARDALSAAKRGEDARGAVVFAANLHVSNLVQHQEARNQYLLNEIQVVDRKIAEIKELQSTKQSLIARMQVIERLQKSRPQIVHLFDELVRTLPNGVHLTSVAQKGTTIEIKGMAESSARVSAYMRNVENSAWLKDPKLGRIETKSDGRVRRSEFSLTVKQESPGSDEAEE
ncbi:MAG: PilN domain-containing protein, partial [Proteobacteria bacterium]|nr:PilN domain-containing protein [Pseudomonadota bacterium]